MRRRARVSSGVVQSVTSAAPSIHDDQAARIKRYLITMGIRAGCFFAAILTQGAVRWSFVVGAVVLPYIAVVMANAVGPRRGQSVPMMQPGPEDVPRLPSGTDPDGSPTPLTHP